MRETQFREKNEEEEQMKHLFARLWVPVLAGLLMIAA
jgi:hypothetical protein